MLNMTVIVCLFFLNRGRPLVKTCDKAPILFYYSESGYILVVLKLQVYTLTQNNCEIAKYIDIMCRAKITAQY